MDDLIEGIPELDTASVTLSNQLIMLGLTATTFESEVGGYEANFRSILEKGEANKSLTTREQLHLIHLVHTYKETVEDKGESVAQLIQESNEALDAFNSIQLQLLSDFQQYMSQDLVITGAPADEAISFEIDTSAITWYTHGKNFGTVNVYPESGTIYGSQTIHVYSNGHLGSGIIAIKISAGGHIKYINIPFSSTGHTYEEVDGILNDSAGHFENIEKANVKIANSVHLRLVQIAVIVDIIGAILAEIAAAGICATLIAIILSYLPGIGLALIMAALITAIVALELYIAVQYNKSINLENNKQTAAQVYPRQG